MRNSVVLITGASSGIGKSCAELLARSGYRVYGGSRRGGPQNVPGIVPVTMDVTSDDSVRNAVQLVLDREQRLDVLINNAGSGLAGAVENTSLQEAKDQFDVNFFGVLRACRQALPVMRGQGSGYIVNIGSIGGLIALPYQGLYSASKFALEGLTESLRLEVNRLGIKVVLIEPGDHCTGFTRNRRFTDASGRDAAYRSNLDRAVQRMAAEEQSGPSPDRVAALILKVIQKANPRLRYTTGPVAQRAAACLKRVAPYALIGTLLEAHYGLGK